MSKFIAKFRKDRDYQDDYQNSKKPQSKKVKHENVEMKHMRNKEYETLMDIYEEEERDD